jgi:hypothetical protein
VERNIDVVNNVIYVTIGIAAAVFVMRRLPKTWRV